MGEDEGGGDAVSTSAAPFLLIMALAQWCSITHRTQAHQGATHGKQGLGRSSMPKKVRVRVSVHLNAVKEKKRKEKEKKRTMQNAVPDMRALTTSWNS